MPYFVFEYFIKNTNEIFYVGIGYMDHFFYDDEPPALFSKIANSFDVDYRIVNDNMTKEESGELKDKLLIKYISSGNIVANIQTPLGYPGAYSSSYNYQYMVTPPLITDDFTLHYFGEIDTYDVIEPEYLEHPSFDPKRRIIGNEVKLYFKEPDVNSTESLASIQYGAVYGLENLLSKKFNKNIRVYKSSSSKSVKSVIFSKAPTEVTRTKLRAEGKKIYHLIDVLKFLNKDISEFY